MQQLKPVRETPSKWYNMSTQRTLPMQDSTPWFVKGRLLSIFKQHQSVEVQQIYCGPISVEPALCPIAPLLFQPIRRRRYLQTKTGTISLQLTASDASVCPPAIDIVSIIIDPIPLVEAGSDQVICEGDNALLSTATIGGSTTGVAWTDATGLGSFSPNATTLNAIFIPDPSQVGSTVKLYITTNDPAGPCDAVIDSLLVTINQAPLADAGVNKVICEGESAHLADASFGGSATGVIWSGGFG